MPIIIGKPIDDLPVNGLQFLQANGTIARFERIEDAKAKLESMGIKDFSPFAFVDTDNYLLSGASRIFVERTRQIEEENFYAETDDLYTDRELAKAAVAYIFGRFRYWPTGWLEGWFKPKPNHIDNLVKAGALIAAEIDRLQRKYK